MIGIDIVEIERFSHLSESENFMTKVYCPEEQKYYDETGKRTETLAGIWAAKEAVVKALGTGFGEIAYTDICILHNKEGMPYIKETEKIPYKVFLSISHSVNSAVAVCVLDKTESGNTHTDKEINIKSAAESAEKIAEIEQRLNTRLDNKLDTVVKQFEKALSEVNQIVNLLSQSKTKRRD